MYLYPMYFDDDLIEVIARSERIVPYLDMPLQHINDTMLKRMQRRVNQKDTVALLDKLRSKIDHLVMRTTAIVGFPGETDDQFNELAEFVAEQKFERLGVFTYSFEPDTPAAKLSDHLPDEVKEERRDDLMAVQQQVAFEFNDRQLGRQLDVLIDMPVPGESNAWVGRSYADAPDVDPLVFVTGENLKPGQFVPCEVVAVQDYDLIAVAIDEPR